ncbi:hypothetical protein EON63_11550, partial [archaeon]
MSYTNIIIGTLIAQSLPERTGKQCRERFHNHLEQGIKKGDWTEEEDRVIITLQRIIGNQWAKVKRDVHTPSPPTLPAPST